MSFNKKLGSFLIDRQSGKVRGELHAYDYEVAFFGYIAAPPFDREPELSLSDSEGNVVGFFWDRAIIRKIGRYQLNTNMIRRLYLISRDILNCVKGQNLNNLNSKRMLG